jgi:hypothetical protein
MSSERQQIDRSCPDSKHRPIERLFFEPHWTVSAINFGFFGFSRLLPDHHFIQQLTDQPKRVDLVVMLAGWKA